MIQVSGDQYEGSFKDDQRHGTGESALFANWNFEIVLFIVTTGLLKKRDGEVSETVWVRGDCVQVTLVMVAKAVIAVVSV
jgi:hypothetical protein